jgi:isopentenyl-diphosphate delta-isomerase
VTRDDSLTIMQRKQDHLRIVLEEDVAPQDITTGFERFRLVHCALPELDLTGVDTGASFLGRTLRAPFLISGMTGGVGQGAALNRRLAAAAQALGCAMGVGSQRVALEDPSLSRHFRLRDVAPDILLLANLGAVQLNYGYGVAECQRAVDMIEADALTLHLNPLQEALQAGGNTNWSGLLGRIEAVCAALAVPVVVKEVGWGISGRVAGQLREAGVAAIDIGGAGGTSWSEVERHRAPTARLRRVSGSFAGWGIPTIDSLIMTRSAAPDLPVIVCGGLCTGVEAATAIALGAQVAGFAAPMLRAAAASESGAHDLLAALTDELRLAMFCCGVGTLAELKRADLLVDGVPRRSYA